MSATNDIFGGSLLLRKCVQQPAEATPLKSVMNWRCLMGLLTAALANKDNIRLAVVSDNATHAFRDTKVMPISPK